MKVNSLTKWYVASVMAPTANRGPDYLTWKVHYRGWTPCMEWCRKQFDSDNCVETWRYIGEGVFEFKNEQDRTLFLLRWG